MTQPDPRVLPGETIESLSCARGLHHLCLGCAGCQCHPFKGRHCTGGQCSCHGQDNRMVRPQVGMSAPGGSPAYTGDAA